MRVLMLLLSASLFTFVAPGGDDCGDQVCLYPSDSDKVAKWQPDSSLSKGKRRKDAKKNRKRKSVELQVAVIDGRGSAFVDGRYWPKDGFEIKPGKHELEVRNGDEVIVMGTLTIPRNLGSLRIDVYGDR